MAILKKPYELSVWEDKLKDGKITEHKIAVIGSDIMESPFKVLTPKLKRSINGSNELTFKLHKKIIDTITGEEVINPFVSLVDNEVKLKLKYENNWYDFIVKNAVQSTDKSTYTYTATDLHINELSKTGYQVELDTELMNNMGTAEELLAQVLADAPGWNTDDIPQESAFKQTQEDIIVKITVSGTLANGDFYTPYSDCISNPSEFRLIPASLENIPKINEVYDFSGVTHKYLLFTKEDYQRTSDSLFFFPILKGDTSFEVTSAKFVEDEGSKLRGLFKKRSNKTIYSPVLDKVVTKYKKTNDLNTYYGYTTTDYVTSNVIANLVTNSDFTSTSGWKGASIGGDNKDLVPIISAGAFVQGEPDLTFIKNITAENTESNPLFTAEYTRCLEITVPKSSKLGYKDKDGNIKWQEDSSQWKALENGTPCIVNSGFYDNRTIIGNLSRNKEYTLEMDWASGYSPSFTDDVDTSISIEVGTYTYDASNNSYEKGNNDYTFLSSFTPMKDKRGKDISGKYKATVSLPDECFTDKEYQNLKTQIFINLKSGLSSLALSDAPYKTTTYLDEKDSEVEIEGNKANIKGYFGVILKLTNFKIYETVTASIDTEGNAVYVEPDNQTITSVPVTTYYFFKDNDGYLDILGQKKQAEDIEYQDILADNASNIYLIGAYTPSRTEDKVKSITASKSNYFNIIQQICETFECWAKFEIEHDEETGKIKSKKVTLHKEVGKLNEDATIKYDVNLKKTQRTIDSKQVVSRLIVPNNSNEYADGGFCSITKSRNNPTGENDIFNFSYYLKKGMIDEEELDKLLYTKFSGGSGGYYVQMREYNNNYDTANDAYQKCATPLLKALSDKTQAEAQLEQSQKLYEEEVAKFESSTNVTLNDLSTEGTTEGTQAYKIIQQLDYNTSYREMLMNISTYYNAMKAAESDLEKANSAYQTYKEQAGIYQGAMDTASTKKTDLTKNFMSLMGRFVQEGTWKDDSYMDDDKYYIDALQTSYNSCMPQVSYTFDIIDVSQAANKPEGNFNFDLGDQIKVIDTEMFGDSDEPITLTEITYDLDDVSKNTFKFQNYRNQFADLFQRTAATVQQVQYASGDWAKAAGFAMDTSSDQAKFLQNALNDAELELANAGEQSVVWDTNGITVTDLKTPSKQIRIVGGALLLRDEDGDGLGWKAGLTSSGLSAKLITSGQLNTGLIQIMNGEEPYFRWDHNGISAFWFENTEDGKHTYNLDPNKGVRFDRFGLYGYNLDATTQNEEGGSTEYGLTWHPNSIEEAMQRSMFALTWDGLFMRLGGGSYKYGREIVWDDDAKEWVNQTRRIIETKTENGKEVEVLSSKSHQGQAWLGTPYAGMPDYEGKDEIYNDWLPAEDGYGDYKGMPRYDFSEKAKGNPTFVPVFTVKANGQDNLIIYDDGTIMARHIKLLDQPEYINDISPNKDVYGQSNAKFVISQRDGEGSSLNLNAVTELKIADIPPNGNKYNADYDVDDVSDWWGREVEKTIVNDEGEEEKVTITGVARKFPNKAWVYAKSFSEPIGEFNNAQKQLQKDDKESTARHVLLDENVEFVDEDDNKITGINDGITTWHKDFNSVDDVYYCHTNDFGRTWNGPFLLTGRSIMSTEMEYHEVDEGGDLSIYGGTRPTLGWFEAVRKVEKTDENGDIILDGKGDIVLIDDPDGKVNASTIDWIDESNLAKLKLKEGTWLYMRVRDKYQDETTSSWRYSVSYIAQGSVNYSITLTPDVLRNSITTENGYTSETVRATFTRSFGSTLVIPVTDTETSKISVYMDGSQEINLLRSEDIKDNNEELIYKQYADDNKTSKDGVVTERAIVLYVDKAPGNKKHTDQANTTTEVATIAPQSYMTFVVRNKDQNGNELVVASKSMVVDIATIGYEIEFDTSALVRSIDGKQNVSFSPTNSTMTLKTVCRNYDKQLEICKKSEESDAYVVSDAYKWEVYGYEGLNYEVCTPTTKKPILTAGANENIININWQQAIDILDEQNGEGKTVDSKELSHIGVRVYENDVLLTETKLIIQDNPFSNYYLDIENDWASIPTVEGTERKVSDTVVKGWSQDVYLEMHAGDSVFDFDSNWTISSDVDESSIYVVTPSGEKEKDPKWLLSDGRAKFTITLNEDYFKNNSYLPESISGDYPITFTAKRGEGASVASYKAKFVGSRLQAPANVIGHRISDIPSTIVCHVNNENSYSPDQIKPILYEKIYVENNGKKFKEEEVLGVDWKYIFKGEETERDFNSDTKSLMAQTENNITTYRNSGVLILRAYVGDVMYDQEEINIAADGKDGKSIKSINEYYFAYEEEVTFQKTVVNKEDGYYATTTKQKDDGSYLELGPWQTSISACEYSANKPYLYNFEVITYTNADTGTTEPDLIAHWGQDGMDVKEIHEFYITTTSQAAMPTTSDIEVKVSTNEEAGEVSFEVTSNDWSKTYPAQDNEVNEGEFIWEADVFCYTKPINGYYYRITVPRIVTGQAYNPYQLTLSNDKDFVVTGNNGEFDEDDFDNTKTTVKVLKGGAYLTADEMGDNWFVNVESDNVSFTTDVNYTLINGVKWYPIDANGLEFHITSFTGEAGKLIFNATKFKITVEDDGTKSYKPILYATSTSYNIAKIKTGANTIRLEVENDTEAIPVMKVANNFAYIHPDTVTKYFDPVMKLRLWDGTEQVKLGEDDVTISDTGSIYDLTSSADDSGTVSVEIKLDSSKLTPAKEADDNANYYTLSLSNGDAFKLPISIFYNNSIYSADFVGRISTYAGALDEAIEIRDENGATVGSIAYRLSDSGEVSYEPQEIQLGYWIIQQTVNENGTSSTEKQYITDKLNWQYSLNGSDNWTNCDSSIDTAKLLKTKNTGTIAFRALLDGIEMADTETLNILSDGLDGMSFGFNCSHDYIGCDKKGNYKTQAIEFTPLMYIGQRKFNLFTDSVYGPKMRLEVLIDEKDTRLNSDTNWLAKWEGAEDNKLGENTYYGNSVSYDNNGKLTITLDSKQGVGDVASSIRPEIDIQFNVYYKFGDDTNYTLVETQTLEVREDAIDGADALYYYFDTNQDYFKYENEGISSDLTFKAYVREGNGTAEVINAGSNNSNYNDYPVYYKIGETYTNLTGPNDGTYTISKDILKSAAGGVLTLKLYSKDQVWKNNSQSPQNIDDALATRSIAIYSDGASVSGITEYYRAIPYPSFEAWKNDGNTNKDYANFASTYGFNSNTYKPDSNWSADDTPSDYTYGTWLWNIEETTIKAPNGNTTIVYSKPAMLNAYKDKELNLTSIYRINDSTDLYFDLTDILDGNVTISGQESKTLNGSFWLKNDNNSYTKITSSNKGNANVTWDKIYYSTSKNSTNIYGAVFLENGQLSTNTINEILSQNEPIYGNSSNETEEYYTTFKPTGDIDAGEEIREYNVRTYSDGSWIDLKESYLYKKDASEYKIVLTKDNEIILVGKEEDNNTETDTNDFQNAKTGIEFFAKGQKQNLTEINIKENTASTTATAKILSKTWTFAAELTDGLGGKFVEETKTINGASESKLYYQLTSLTKETGSVTFHAYDEDGKAAFDALYGVNKKEVTKGANGVTMWIEVTPSSISVDKNGNANANIITAQIKTCDWANNGGPETYTAAGFKVYQGNSCLFSSKGSSSQNDLSFSVASGVLTIQETTNKKFESSLTINTYADSTCNNFLVAHTVDVVKDGADGVDGSQGSKGDTGPSGKDSCYLNIINDWASIPMKEGNTTLANNWQSWTQEIGVRFYKGDNALQWTDSMVANISYDKDEIYTVTPNGIDSSDSTVCKYTITLNKTIEINNTNKTVINDNGVIQPDFVETSGDYKVLFTYKYNDSYYEEYFVGSISIPGPDGQPGDPAITYKLYPGTPVITRQVDGSYSPSTVTPILKKGKGSDFSEVTNATYHYKLNGGPKDTNYSEISNGTLTLSSVSGIEEAKTIRFYAKENGVLKDTEEIGINVSVQGASTEIYRIEVEPDTLVLDKDNNLTINKFTCTLYKDTGDKHENASGYFYIRVYKEGVSNPQEWIFYSDSAVGTKTIDSKTTGQGQTTLFSNITSDSCFVVIDVYAAGNANGPKLASKTLKVVKSGGQGPTGYTHVQETQYSMGDTSLWGKSTYSPWDSLKNGVQGDGNSFSSQAEKYPLSEGAVGKGQYMWRRLIEYDKDSDNNVISGTEIITQDTTFLVCNGGEYSNTTVNDPKWEDRTEATYYLAQNYVTDSTVNAPPTENNNNWKLTEPTLSNGQVLYTKTVVTNYKYLNEARTKYYSNSNTTIKIAKAYKPSEIKLDDATWLAYFTITQGDYKKTFYLDENQNALYINASYINSGALTVKSGDDVVFQAVCKDLVENATDDTEKAGYVKIGGWEVTSNSFTHTSKDSNNKEIVDYGLYSDGSGGFIGDSSTTDWALTIGNKFGVKKDGTLYATGAQVGASVNSLGGWTITNNYIYGKNTWTNSGGSVTKYVGLIATNIDGSKDEKAFYAGATNNDGTDAKFYVTNNGFFCSTSGKIASWTIDDNSIRTGSLGAEKSMWLCTGSSTFATIGSSSRQNGWCIGVGEKFGVDNTGALYASAGRIGGMVVADNSINTVYHKDAAASYLYLTGSYSGLEETNAVYSSSKCQQVKEAMIFSYRNMGTNVYGDGKLTVNKGYSTRAYITGGGAIGCEELRIIQHRAATSSRTSGFAGNTFTLLIAPNEPNTTSSYIDEAIELQVTVPSNPYNGQTCSLKAVYRSNKVIDINDNVINVIQEDTTSNASSSTIAGGKVNTNFYHALI